MDHAAPLVDLGAHTFNLRLRRQRIGNDADVEQPFLHIRRDPRTR
jgi:hypothetical protein